MERSPWPGEAHLTSEATPAMTYALRFSGTTRVSEGETATVTVPAAPLGCQVRRLQLAISLRSRVGRLIPMSEALHLKPTTRH